MDSTFQPKRPLQTAADHTGTKVRNGSGVENSPEEADIARPGWHFCSEPTAERCWCRKSSILCDVYSVALLSHFPDFALFGIFGGAGIRAVRAGSCIKCSFVDRC